MGKVNKPDCEFCGKPFHFGFCDEMRAYNERQQDQLKPTVNPHVRHG